MLKDIFSAAERHVIPYFTFGDPNIEFTRELIINAYDSGASIIELGIPFSDPIADGPVIQASHHRALTHSTQECSLENALHFAANLATSHNIPLVFMMSVNLVYHMGIKEFFEKAAESKVAGVVIPDLTLEEADEYLAHSRHYNVPIIFLVSPLISENRLKAVCENAEGFIYLISSTGVTGERKTFSHAIEDQVSRIRAYTDIPVAVGFGISSKEHVSNVFNYAEGAIVGSHLVKSVEQNLLNLDRASDAISGIIRDFVSAR